MNLQAPKFRPLINLPSSHPDAFLSDQAESFVGNLFSHMKNLVIPKSQINYLKERLEPEELFLQRMKLLEEQRAKIR